MRETIETLVELQRVDDEIGAYAIQRDELSANLQRLRSIVERMAAELEQKREKLNEATSFYQEKQIDLQGDADRLTRAKQKLAGVTRTKEYKAIQTELETLRRKFVENETELKQLAEAIEQYEASIAEEEERLAELKQEVSREETASADRLGELETTISDIAERKEALRVDLPRQLIGRYERILKQRDGRAVVPVTEGKCTGCQMMLPPQMYILVQRGDSVQSCPSCQRYLYCEEYPEANYELDRE